MTPAAWILAGLALALAWPVPIALSRAAWPQRHPVRALVLWQTVALAGGLAMIGSLVCWGLAPFGSRPADAAAAVVGLFAHGAYISTRGLAHLFILSCALLLFAHLVSILALTGVRMSRRRRRHLEALKLVAHEDPSRRNRLILDSNLPLAYCLPSTTGSVTVVTEGILTALSPDELDAVLEHERAHVAQRHDILVWAFSAWRAALPWLPTARLALGAVSELIEFLADDFAAGRHAPKTVARALVVVAEAGAAGQAGEENRSAFGLPAADDERESPGGGRTLRRALRLARR
ncbi:M56 family metallopeptidase [Arthrobacter sp. UM1]|uniref:M56 family metallopeptidase n=1 Tax=Arthrobacter sp. UM1 TaxID=2766776 RepID=UPI001CF6D7D5|nr:M56 family metallopeptidase [Arthrobacter sp. UM1]MCB4207668.1 M56 family metallopeptidase [Arthrobacter sp. UM1]